MPELNKFTNQITGVKTFIKSKMIGAYAIASLSALIVAHVFGVISPNTKIKKVIINVAILTAAPPKEYAIKEAIDCESSHGYWEDEGEYVDEGWWEFSLDRYSASLSATMDLTTDAKSPTATATTIKSGYGVNISVNASVSTGQSSATTPPQTAVSYFPEFYYKTYWRLLDRTRSGYHAGFEFRNNHYSTYNRRTHFTPVWMPNGTYTVYTYLLDCWTPDGMLSVNLTDSVQISGDLWDDWHIAPQRAR